MLTRSMPSIFCHTSAICFRRRSERT
jgi:hypothetical protein